MKTKKLLLAVSVIANCLLPTISFSQNIAINQTGNPANTSALLDVDATNKGVLIPRVSLNSTTDAATIATPATSLLVYNTGSGGLSPAGYYFNSGTPASPQWKQLISTNSTVSCSADWTLVAVINSTKATLGDFSSSPAFFMQSDKEYLIIP